MTLGGISEKSLQHFHEFVNYFQNKKSTFLLNRFRFFDRFY